MRRPALLVALLAGLVVVLKRRASVGQADKDLWTEATSTPDLR